MTAPDDNVDAEFDGALGSFSLNVRLDLPMRGVTGLFGPSGCGKTTILRAMAGLLRLPGRLSVGGEIWQDDAVGVFLPPHKRQVGYVFQEASLFPHLSVRQNLLFGARRARQQMGRTAIALDDIVRILGMGHLLGRDPISLSGGERQRVAVGRALLSQPGLLLMDEPLSGLDRMSKDEILPYFEALHHHLSIPIVYVSHDIGEVERLADHLVLIEAGRVTASGPLHALQEDPELSLLSAPEAAVTLDGEVDRLDLDYQLTHFAVAGGVLLVPGDHGARGSRGRLRISAADVSFALSRPADSTIVNVLPARIVSISPHRGDGAQVNVVAALGENGDGARIVARITRKSQELLEIVEGRQVFAQIKGVSLLATGAAQERAGGKDAFSAPAPSRVPSDPR